jgi:hypothetical protein
LAGGASFPEPAPYGGPAPSGGAGTTPAAPKHTRFYGTARLDPERFGRDLDRLYQEVIQHLAPSVNLREARIGVSATNVHGPLAVISLSISFAALEVFALAGGAHQRPRPLAGLS